MELVVIAILILINGFFALSEIALVSSRRSRLERYREEGHKGSQTAIRLMEDSERFLSAIQVGITLIGIITGVYGGLNIADDITPLIRKVDFLSQSAEEISLTLTVLTITFFSILLGELVPKTVALSNPEKIAIITAPIIYYLSILLYPFVRLLSASTSLINRVIGIRKKNDQITEAELRQIIKSASLDGVIEKEQSLVHQKVFHLSDKKAKHIMTHRTEVDWIDLNQAFQTIREEVIRSGHSRLVCCRDDLDNFQGILNVKDFLSEALSKGEFDVSDIIIQPVIVPESTEVHKVLDQFKKKKIYFSIVVDEYGSFEGIITLHDILENLIGEIPDEGEIAEPDIFLREDNSYLVNGDAPTDVLDGIIENHVTDYENIDYSTVAGFVINKIDKIPEVGDSFIYNDYIIEIVDIDGKRIDKILIRKK